MILYLETTQIRLCIDITYTGKRENICYILEYIIIIFCSFSYHRDMPYWSVLFLYKKNIQIKFCCMITPNDNPLIIIVVVNTVVIFLILFL